MKRLAGTALLVIFTASAWAAPEAAYDFRITARAQGAALDVNVQYEQGADAEGGDAVIVASYPSRTRLIALVNNDGAERGRRYAAWRAKGAPAVEFASASHARVAATLNVPLAAAAAADTHIVVTLLRGGTEHVISYAHVASAREFGFRTQVLDDEGLNANPLRNYDMLAKNQGRTRSGEIQLVQFFPPPDPGSGGSGGKYRHCCSGGNCSQMCVTCTSAFFNCNLVTCSINCA